MMGDPPAVAATGTTPSQAHLFVVSTDGSVQVGLPSRPAKVDARFQLVEVHQVVHQKVQVVQVDQVDLELVELGA